MANLNVDTKKLKESGQDIIVLTRELNEEFSALFSRISNMATKTYEWVGPSSQQFIERTNLERAQYRKIIQTLYKYGRILVETSNEYETVAKKIG